MNLLTVKEVSKQLKVSEDTVLNLITSQKLSAAKIGKQWRIVESDLLSYFKSRLIESKRQLKQQYENAG